MNGNGNGMHGNAWPDDRAAANDFLDSLKGDGHMPSYAYTARCLASCATALEAENPDSVGALFA